MDLDDIWTAFAETGGPAFYMLYRSYERARGREREATKDGLGEAPRAED
ncbi:MAG: hypothetical protein IK095_09475 [Oscillospiraceae bacterium]|nr:hypothetical protein [Oscillospiraceae bacterium]